MSKEKSPPPFTTEFLEKVASSILQNMQMITDEPIGLHIMVCTHGMNMRVSNITPAALKEALNFALQKLDQEGATH